MKFFARTICSAALVALAAPLSAQEQSAEPEEQTSQPDDSTIVVTGDAADDSGESVRQRVLRVGRKITRPARSGRPVSRFEDPICVMVSGMPEDASALIKGRIEDNARSLRGVKIDDDPDCKANAFLGFLNNVNDAVEGLEKSEPWLFEGLKSYQRDRIYKGSKFVRAWHRFETVNDDGSGVPDQDNNRVDDIASKVNRTERASRVQRLRSEMRGAVVLIETAALREKTLRQIADYATLRILASVNDDVTSDANTPPTILTLFNEDFGPAAITDFDIAYLEALYELSGISSDSAIIAAAVDRYMDRIDDSPGN